MYEQLKELISKNNQKNSELNDIIHKLENDCCNIESDELEIAKFTKWQFVHDYATELSNFLWEHKQELTAKDLSALDSVLYNVWQKMSEKSNIIVQIITEIHKEETVDQQKSD